MRGRKRGHHTRNTIENISAWIRTYALPCGDLFFTPPLSKKNVGSFSWYHCCHGNDTIVTLPLRILFPRRVSDVERPVDLVRLSQRIFHGSSVALIGSHLGPGRRRKGCVTHHWPNASIVNV